MNQTGERAESDIRNPASPGTLAGEPPAPFGAVPDPPPSVPVAPKLGRKPRILLVSASFEENTFEETSNDRALAQHRLDNSHYPIGVPYLHTYIESRGNEMKTLFLNLVSYDICFEEVEKAIQEYRPDIVGLQMLTQNRVCSYRLMEKIHRDYPGIHLVIGGIHATIMHEQLIRRYPYLIAVIGEGELTFAELIEKLMVGEDISGVKGIAYMKDGQFVRPPPRPLIADLDILPFPKHELFFDHEREFGCLLTSRGCPFRCSFCALESITRHVNRTRSVKNVVDEIEHMTKKFPQMKRIWIHDDTFFLNNQRVIEFCDEVIRRGIGVEFIASGRLKPVSAEMIKKLEEARFTKILFGLESGTDEILFKAHKGITRKDVLETFNLLRHTKIEVVCFLIVGLPGETMDTVHSTARFVQHLQTIKYIYYNDIGILIIYPGTEVFRLAKEKGIITEDFWLTDGITPFYTAEHSIEELRRFKKITLDHISVTRYFTLDGLRAQLGMTPYIPRFLWEKRDAIMSRVKRKLVPEQIHAGGAHQ